MGVWLAYESILRDFGSQVTELGLGFGVQGSGLGLTSPKALLAMMMCRRWWMRVLEVLVLQVLVNKPRTSHVLCMMQYLGCAEGELPEERRVVVFALLLDFGRDRRGDVWQGQGRRLGR